MESSCFLYHGPGARETALAAASAIGRLVAPPFGEDGLKVDEAREMVGLLQIAPVGVGRGVVVAGPLDLANTKACDVLLKSIEEFDGLLVQPILWAFDLGAVPVTVRSRCLVEWSPTDPQQVDESLEQVGMELVDAVHTGSLYKIPSLMSAWKGREAEVVRSIAAALAADPTPEALILWQRLRSIALFPNVTALEVIAALVS